MKDRKIIKDLPLVLEEQLRIIAGDDGINYWEYSDKEIIDECKEHQLRYDGGIGFDEQEMLSGDYGIEDKKIAQKEYRDIKRFNKKYN